MRPKISLHREILRRVAKFPRRSPVKWPPESVRVMYGPCRKKLSALDSTTLPPLAEAAPFILIFRRARPKIVFLGARYRGNYGVGDLSVGWFHTVWVGAQSDKWQFGKCSNLQRCSRAGPMPGGCAEKSAVRPKIGCARF